MKVRYRGIMLRCCCPYSASSYLLSVGHFLLKVKHSIGTDCTIFLVTTAWLFWRNVNRHFSARLLLICFLPPTGSTSTSLHCEDITFEQCNPYSWRLSLVVKLSIHTIMRYPISSTCGKFLAPLHPCACTIHILHRWKKSQWLQSFCFFVSLLSYSVGVMVSGRWKRKRKGFQRPHDKWMRFSCPVTEGYFIILAHIFCAEKAT